MSLLAGLFMGSHAAFPALHGPIAKRWRKFRTGLRGLSPYAQQVSEDRHLLAAWREGDSRAGSQLFDRHYPRLARFFRNKVADELYDLIQQTMLTCLERADQLRDDERFAAFLLGIATEYATREQLSRD